MNYTAVLVAIRSGKTRIEDTIEYLDELALLAETMDICAIKRFVQRIPRPDARTFIRKGKLEEIKKFVELHRVPNVIFDDDLSPSQLRNIEREFNPQNSNADVRVYDRSLLILNIFLLRARTAQARVQVDLAMNQYLLPRLTRMWTHLERQRGGTGTRGGAGEKELETDRRNISTQISVLKNKLKKIDRQNKTRRNARKNIVRVALVGYTNAGKSTLMNLLSKADVKAEDKLFATIDTTVRRVFVNGISFLLSDTVGFIRKLPSHLIASFKSTLDEVREADILLHVTSIAHPYHMSHIETVNKTLTDIGAIDIPTILVLNKVDLLKEQDAEIESYKMANNYEHYGFEATAFVSATTEENVDALKRSIFYAVKKRHEMIYPNSQTPLFTTP